MRSLTPKTYQLKPSSAYIAITAAIIITIMILALVATVSSTGYFGRFNVLGSLIKEEGDALAEACADTALLGLALDSDYAGATTTEIENSTCTILAIEDSASHEKTIRVQSEKADSITNIEIILRTTDFNILSWDEVESF